MTSEQKQFIKAMQGHDGEAPYRTFERFCEMAYCALAKPMAPPVFADELEARYMRNVGQMKPARVTEFAELLGVVGMALQQDGRDFLGPVMMCDEVSAANRHAGQFFTPFDVSKMMALMTLHDMADRIAEQDYLTIGEPACGSGGMILAVLAVAKDQGVDTRRLWFDATDISPLCCWMTSIQMAMAGAIGIVHCDDTLCPRRPEKGERVEEALTPQSWRFLGRYGWPGRTLVDAPRGDDEAESIENANDSGRSLDEPSASSTLVGQGSLF